MTSDRAYSTQNQIFFYGLFALLAAAILWLLGSYIGVIAFSLLMVIILKPVHRFLMRHLGNRSGLATLLTLQQFPVPEVESDIFRKDFAQNRPSTSGGVNKSSGNCC